MEEEEEEDEEDLERRRSARRDSAGSEESETGDQRRKNQFSFLERATQTRIRPVKVNSRSLLSSFLLNLVQSTGVQTEAAERLVFTETVNQGRIYDTYQSYDLIKDQADLEDSETAEEPELAGDRLDLAVELVEF